MKKVMTSTDLDRIEVLFTDHIYGVASAIGCSDKMTRAEMKMVTDIQKRITKELESFINQNLERIVEGCLNNKRKVLNIPYGLATRFTYTEFLIRGNPAPEPKNPTYRAGDIVKVETEDDNGFAVVLGCIDENCDGELRLDLCGMTSIDNVRHATMEELNESDSESAVRIRGYLQ